jgi:hypothetical protein
MIQGTAKNRRSVPVLLLVLVLMAWMGVMAPSGRAQADVRLQQVQTRLVEGTYRMDALLGFDFSAAALEALDNGVPLTILIQIQVRRAGAWIWEDSLLDLRLQYAIRYRPLSERYEVSRLPATEGRDFVSRDAAIRALGELTDLALIDAARLDPESQYEIHLRASLDIEELPLPLRPRAYLSSAWKLSSGWRKWPLTP